MLPWSKCNVLVGQNNSGKSNIIRGLKTAVDAAKKHPVNAPIESFDLDSLHRRNLDTPFEFVLWFDHLPGNEFWPMLGTDMVWFRFLVQHGRAMTIHDSTFHTLNGGKRLERETSAAYVTRWRSVHTAITSSRLPNVLSESELKRALGDAASLAFRDIFRPHLPEVEIIPEFRRIAPGEHYTLSGTNLNVQLARFQHPPVGHEDLQERFRVVERFVRRLLHMPEAALEVEDESKEILLTNDGLRLKLASYGTGVHELVILLTAVLSNDNAVYCIEEPEIHLHPRLQREFIEFLAKQTKARYLLSSHSASFINAHVGADEISDSPVQVFHVRNNASGTTATQVFADDDVLVALDDLGVHASDILQANCVVWVEGPSDRIFLNQWLSIVASDLVEGLHFSVMFYGGRLLSHLSLEREATSEDLIKLLRVNQRAIVVMDSDKSHADGRTKGGRLNATKKRVRDEVRESGGISWVTDGREVENYLSNAVLDKFCANECNATASVKLKRFEKIDTALRRALKNAQREDVNRKIRTIEYSSDKVRYSREIAALIEEADIGTGLRNRLETVVKAIRRWNA